MRLPFVALLGALALPAAALPAAPAAAQNWNAQYVATPTGHRVGNPDAPIQLIEYVSYTCPHCAHFESESEAELRYHYIHQGYVAVEVRHLLRNGLDVAIALAAECGPDDAFFDNHRMFLNTQDTWIAKARALSPEQQARWSAGTTPDQFRAMASDLDFYEMMEPRGVSRSQLDACLTDRARILEITAESEANAAEYGVQGTPSFVVNGQLLDGVHAWPSLRQVLAALRQEAPAGAS